MSGVNTHLEEPMLEHNNLTELWYDSDTSFKISFQMIALIDLAYAHSSFDNPAL